MLPVMNKKVSIFMFKAMIALLIASCVMCSDVSAGIDTSPSYSEAIIMFDAASMDIKVYNSEDGREAGYELPPNPCFPPNPVDEDGMGWELRQYTLTDSAGNTLVLNLNYKKEGREVKVEVLCMQYNDGAIMEVPKNKMQAEFSIYGNGTLKELEQKIKVKGLFEARAKFNARKNQTEICVPPSPCIAEIRTHVLAQ